MTQKVIVQVYSQSSKQVCLSCITNQTKINKWKKYELNLEVRTKFKVISIKLFHPYREAYLEHVLIKYLCQVYQVGNNRCYVFFFFFHFFSSIFFLISKQKIKLEKHRIKIAAAKVHKMYTWNAQG